MTAAVTKLIFLCCFWVIFECFGDSQSPTCTLEHELKSCVRYPACWQKRKCIGKLVIYYVNHVATFQDKLFLDGDVELNPGLSSLHGQKPHPDYTFTLDAVKNSTGLKIAHLNINGLYGKIDQLRVMLSHQPLHIHALSETKLCDAIRSSELYINSWSEKTELDEEAV